eukprot:m.6674 g.6674  ORF g.6674 m.6674 type:complete len:463 (-) comp4831_c0_seq1:29-1417(-)
MTPLFLVLLLVLSGTSQPTNNGFVGLDDTNSLVVTAPPGGSIKMSGANILANGDDIGAALRALAALTQDVSTLKAANADKDIKLSSLTAQLASTNATLQQLQSTLVSVSLNSTAQISQFNNTLVSTQTQLLSTTQQQLTTCLSTAIATSTQDNALYFLTTIQPNLFFRDWVFLRREPRVLGRFDSATLPLVAVSGLVELSSSPNTIVVVDTLNQTILRIALDNQSPLSSVIIKNTSLLRNPIGLTVAGNTLITYDSADKRCKGFDLTNNSLVWTSSNTFGASPNYFGDVFHIEALPTGRFLVSDRDNQRLLMFNSSTGAFIGVMQIASPGPGTFKPTGFTFDPTTWTLFVADIDGVRVLVFSLNSSTHIATYVRLYTLPGSSRAGGVAYHAPSKTLFVGEITRADHMYMIQTTDNTVSFFPCDLPSSTMPCQRPFIRTIGGFGLYVSAAQASSPWSGVLALY